MKPTITYLVTACLLGYMLAAQAGIMLDRSVIDFQPGDLPRKDVAVINQGDDTAYVTVEVLEVRNPGTEHEERTVVTDVETMSLIATPSKLAIPPGGRKHVRLIDLTPHAKKERVYRVNFTPVLPPLTDPAVDGMGIHILVAYQVLVLIPPEKPVEKLVVTRNGKTIYFENQGNSYARVTNITQCDPIGEHCEDGFRGKRLYPGNTFTLEVPYANTPVQYRLTTFKGMRKATIP